ncbi:14007_t:CDS:2, partial [Acaulospora colombiana]
MLCFAVDNRDSLDNIGTKWANELIEYCPGVKVVLVALKCDLREDIQAVRNMQRLGERPVTYDEGLAVARSIRASRYLECSARHNRGVREAFEQAARVSIHAKPKEIRAHKIPGPPNPPYPPPPYPPISPPGQAENEQASSTLQDGHNSNLGTEEISEPSSTQPERREAYFG